MSYPKERAGAQGVHDSLITDRACVPARMLLGVTVPELRQIVLGLSMVPVASDLHRRFSAQLHVETLYQIPADCRRVWWRSFKNGDERSVEWYDEAMCERIDRAVIRAMLRRYTARTVK